MLCSGENPCGNNGTCVDWKKVTSSHQVVENRNELGGKNRCFDKQNKLFCVCVDGYGGRKCEHCWFTFYCF